MKDFIETAELFRISQIRSQPSLLPQSRGVYGLFFARPPGATPMAGCFQRDGLSLLYVGTAGADPRKNGTLRARLGKQHLGGNERRSTLCQTLAALLPDVAGPALIKNERSGIKFHTSPEGIRRLQKWMDENISACWLEAPRPSDLEEGLVKKYLPPLNIDFSEHPFSIQLSSLRADRRSSALGNPVTSI